MVRTKGSFKRPFLELLVWSCEAVVAVYLLYLGVQLVQAVPYTKKSIHLRSCLVQVLFGFAILKGAQFSVLFTDN